MHRADETTKDPILTTRSEGQEEVKISEKVSDTCARKLSFENTVTLAAPEDASAAAVARTHGNSFESSPDTAEAGEV